VQRKAYVLGTAALLAAVLTGCSSETGSGASPDDSKPYEAGASATPAPPGKYRTLPEACAQVDHGTLDTMLPGIKTITDEKQREQAYQGTETLTYDTDRRVGCRWTGESPNATDHLLIDFERVVSYDTTVSDDTRAQQVFASKEVDANLQPSATGTVPGSTPGADGGEGLSPDSGDAGTDGTGGAGDSCGPPSAAGTDDGPGSGPGSEADAGSDAGAGAAHGLQPRLIRNLGDAAFLDDSCAAPSSAARHPTVTVAFRTSNVIVTIEYDEQPSRPNDAPDLKKMQDTAQELAHLLDGKLGD
jgi:hypothetical protein